MPGRFCKNDNPSKFNQKGEGCTDCPEGHRCPSRGMTAPVMCEIGTFQAAARSTACSNCTSGSYADQQGLVECRECLPGKFASGSGLTACSNCTAGKYANDKASSSCVPCTNGNVYQPYEGQDHCVRCPPGYKNRLRSSMPTKVDGYTSVDDACDMCPPGTYSSSIGVDACTQCDIGSFNPLSGQTSCRKCPNNKTTAYNGSTSEGQCTCQSGKFDSGTGVCVPCGTCLLNEYVVGTCGNYSDVQCAACRFPCPGGSKDQFVASSGMCNGYGTSSSQTCSPCRTELQCSQSDRQQEYHRLFPCLSGTGSYDTSVCIRKSDYVSPLEFSCNAGYYQDPFSLTSSSSSSSYGGGQKPQFLVCEHT